MNKYKIVIRDETQFQQLELFTIQDKVTALTIFSSLELNFNTGGLYPKFRHGYLILMEKIDKSDIYQIINQKKYEK